MWIEFFIEDTRHSIIDLPLNKRLPMVQGIPLLEEVNRELLASKQEETIDYFVYTEKNQELATLAATLTLPVENQTMVEAIVAPVRNNKEIDSEDAQAFLALFKKSLPKEKRLKETKKKKIEPKIPQNKSNKELFIHIPWSRGKGVKLTTFFKCAFLFFLPLIGIHIGRVTQPEPKIPDEVKNQQISLEKQVQQQDKIDTFSRFFLTNYYTGLKDKRKVQDQVERFVEKDVLNDFSGTEEKVKSILPWNKEYKNKEWQVSFVITLQGTKEQTTTQKVSFSIKEKNGKYKVQNVPESERFVINE
ncbi:hypothetical protein SHT67_14320 (plasmid) [Enterococcus faecalis]|uniref:hypothetical protein n=1 Tax=Enterococcus faecalis TaxID=1351 RepID=UPI0029C95B2A|nr:hypothetical protein [Enterococcus faecalis]WPH48350.1 hypothetical protein SHT67_14320 [Enterococcus faecalis]